MTMQIQFMPYSDNSVNSSLMGAVQLTVAKQPLSKHDIVSIKWCKVT